MSGSKVIVLGSQARVLSTFQAAFYLQYKEQGVKIPESVTNKSENHCCVCLGQRIIILTSSSIRGNQTLAGAYNE